MAGDGPMVRGRNRACSLVYNEEGSFHLALASLLGVLVLAGLGIWGVLRFWRFQVETQLRLDRCVGEVARKLQGHLNFFEKTNTSIQSLRGAVRVAQLALQWEAVPPLVSGIEALVVSQEALIKQWEWESMLWPKKQGCGKWGDQAEALPSLRLNRALPDELGHQPLEWEEEMPDEFRIEIRSRFRRAAARVVWDLESKGMDKTISHRWMAEWTEASAVLGLRPGSLRWPNLR